MNDKNVIYFSNILPFENETIVRSFENEKRLSFYSFKDIVKCAENLIKEKKFDDFHKILGLFSQTDDFYQLLKDEHFLIAFLKYKLHLQQFSEIIQFLQNIESTCNSVFLELWDEVHYQQYLAVHGRLTPVHKFRIRQKNPPPSGICVGGVRPNKRLLETTSAVFREWFWKHSTYPYPCKSAKQALAKQTGVPVSTVTSWFSNARRKQKLKLQKLIKSSGHGSDENIGQQKTKGSHSKEPYTALEYDEIAEEEISENAMSPSNESIQSEMSPDIFENDVPSWSYNLPTTVQTTHPKDGSTNSGFSLKNHYRVPYSSINEENKKQKYLNAQSDSQLKNLKCWQRLVNKTDDKTEYMHNKHQVKQLVDETKENTVYRHHSFIIKNNHACKEIQEINDNFACNVDARTLNEKVFMDECTTEQTQSQNRQGWVTENFKQAFGDAHANVKTPWKVHSVASDTKKTVKRDTELPDQIKGVDLRERNLLGAYTKQTEVSYKSGFPNAEDKSSFASKYGPIIPKLTLDEMHCETKVQNETLIQKLRKKLKDHQMKKMAWNRRRNIALESLKSLQKLCDDVEETVTSTMDYAYNVDFEALRNTDDIDDFSGSQSSTVYGDIKQRETSHISHRKIPHFDQLVPSSLEFPYSPAEPLVPSLQELPYQFVVSPSELPCTSVILLGTSSSNSLCLPEMQYNTNSTEMHCLTGSCRSPLNEQNRHFHADATDKQILSSSHPEPVGIWRGTGWPPTQTPSTDDKHCISRYSDSYGTVVGEAIQGLLNLSSSQESSESCSTYI